MAIDRTAVIKGPAYVILDGTTIFAKDDIQVRMALETFEVLSATHGKIDERLSNRTIEITFTPAGEWEALTKLFPYAATSLGSSIFSGLDLVIVPIATAGTKITFHDVAVTKMPDLMFSTTKTLIGPVTITAVQVNDTEWAAAAALLATAESSAAVDWTTAIQDGLSVAGILTQDYSIAWGASPWDDIKTVDGLTVSFDMELSPQESDSDGLYDMLFQKLGVTIQGRVIGVTEAQLITALRLQDIGVVRGGSLQSMVATQSDMVITGTGVSATFTAVAMKEAQLVYSAGQGGPRIGVCQWIATRTISSGMQPLFALGTGA